MLLLILLISEMGLFFIKYRLNQWFEAIIIGIILNIIIPECISYSLFLFLLLVSIGLIIHDKNYELIDSRIFGLLLFNYLIIKILFCWT